MSAGTKKNWGGARPNSGPKKETLSVRQIAEMEKAAAAAAVKYGKTIDEILVGFIHDINLSVKDRMAAIKLFKDKTMANITEGGEADQQLGPGVYLPESRPDPGKVIEGKFGSVDTP